MIPAFDVPPQYFYALAAALPPDVSADVRYRLACLSDEATILDVLRRGVDDGTIIADPTITVELAARRLRALGAVRGVTPVVASGVGLALTQAYAAYKTTPPADDPADDIAPFWTSVIGTPALAAAHLELVLCAIIQEADSRPLITAVQGTPVPNGMGNLTLDSVQNLDVDPWPPPHPAELTYADWLAVFTRSPAALPSIAGPGTLQERVGAFVRRLRTFFTVTPGGTGPQGHGPNVPPMLSRPTRDLLAEFFTGYQATPGHGMWEWGDGLDPTDRTTALDSLSLAPDVRAWLEAAVTAVDVLYALCDLPGIDTELRFSLAESLYARGFTDAAGIAALDQQEFVDALIGTPVWASAGAVWKRAGGTDRPPGPAEEFAPVNDGTLVNCLPTCELSPVGDVAYLQALLTLPLGSGATLGGLVATRRGPLAGLGATAANATVAVPAIDLVNECLEQLAATGSLPGAVHDTDPSAVGRHDPAEWFAAQPAFSSPAVPVAQPTAYDLLAQDFSSPGLPYSQPLDLNRRYLETIGTTRYRAMCAFRRDVTEFVLDRAGEPADFPRHVRRYPVRLPLALEYLCLTEVEYTRLFTDSEGAVGLPELYGFAAEDESWQWIVHRLPELLARLGLTYCELADLAATGWLAVHVRSVGDRETVAGLPDCEPCCPADLLVFFGDRDDAQALRALALFVRLWRKLQCLPSGGLSFADLAAACAVLGLFDSGGAVNADFVPQLAAMLMLRADFELDGVPVPQLLALWTPPGPDAVAVEMLIEHIGRFARRRHRCRRVGPDWLKLLARNLDALALLCGFDPATPGRTWYARPTHSLRFAEQLAKVYASGFGIGELLYLCSADAHLEGDDPYPTAPPGEGEVDPLEDPDDDAPNGLWALRTALLGADPTDEVVADYSWRRVTDVLREQLRAPAQTLTALHHLGAHLFPSVLAAAGDTVALAERSYTTTLAGSSAAMWNTPGSPFRYDENAAQLSLVLPFDTERVLIKLSRIRSLQGAEPQAVRDLHAAPRLELTAFGYLFDDLSAAAEQLLAEPDEAARWAYVQRRFALFHVRCQVIVDHLAAHVLASDATDDDTDDRPGGSLEQISAVVWRLLPDLLADENGAVPAGVWEQDDGHRPSVTWTAAPSGGALAALTGLAGTGLLAEFRRTGDTTPMWRDLQTSTALINPVANTWNVPVPTLLPALDTQLPANQQAWAAVRNGMVIAGRSAEVLGGAEGYEVTWSGLLLVEQDGAYTFWGTAPGGRDDDPEASDGRRWTVRLGRGQKQWILLSHDWPEQSDCFSTADLPLRRGCYTVEIELARTAPPDDAVEDAEALRSGLLVEYAGADTAGGRMAIPVTRLYLPAKTGTLADGVDSDLVTGVPRALLEARYVSTVRDVRRTYQRAFKAALLAHRFQLSAEVFADYAQSELGYLLDHRDGIAGLTFYDSGGWLPHRVDLDPTLLPLSDVYRPPAPADDDRSAPSVPRRHAFFDLWERLFDHTALRADAGGAPEAPVWLLYDEAAENQPDNPAQLLRHLGVEIEHADLVLAYEPGHDVTAAELTNERWATRIWFADRLIRSVETAFLFADLGEAQPELWVSPDPLASGGNANLTDLVHDGLVETGPPVRWLDLTRVNDCLRVHARDALVAFLCSLDRIALPWPSGGFARTAADLSDLLLVDVSVGLRHAQTRIGEAICAVHTLVGRARLGAEPPWRPDPGFTDAWDCGYASCAIWARGRRAGLYRENTVVWEELATARRTEAYRLLESELRGAAVSAPAPGGVEFWPAEPIPRHPGLALLQEREASALRLLRPPVEGLGVLGTPGADAQRSWLAAEPGSPAQEGGDGNGDGNGDVVPVPGAVVVRAAVRAPVTRSGAVPLWIETAVRLGARFLRVPAAGPAPASRRFEIPLDRPGEGCRCGRVHEATMDEYYFWLVDTSWYAEIEQVADWPGWHEEDSAAELLEWPARPMAHLMWCHVHDGEIGPPRRSVDGVRVGGTSPQLTLVGRRRDSLVLAVSGGVPAPGTAPPPDPGFRYDLVTDSAVAVPLVTPEATPPAPASGMGKLPAYPYFAYFAPGAPLFPLDPFSESVAVGSALLTRCAYERAVQWYALSYDPTTSNNRWCEPGGEGAESGEGGGGRRATSRALTARLPSGRSRRGRVTRELAIVERAARGGDGGCCDGTDPSAATARRRHVLLETLEALLAWGDCERGRHTGAGDAQARLLFAAVARILGPTPLTVRCDDTCATAEEGEKAAEPLTVAAFVPCGAGLNPRLMVLYEQVADRQALICRDAGPGSDCCCGCDGRGDADCEGSCACCCPPSPYRCSYVLEHATRMAEQVASHGVALEAAYEKGDVEYLSVLRADQEQQVVALTGAVRQEQWRDADWQVQALRVTKQIAQANWNYYNLLILNGLIAGEEDNQALTNASIGAISAATVSEAIGTVLGVIPDVFVGTASFTQLPVGTKLAGVFQGTARISQQVSGILGTTAGLRLNQGGWDRRLVEWKHQRDIFELETAQVERQIDGAERRRDASLRELNIAQRSLENARGVTEMLRDKTTSHAHFLWLQRETAALHRQMYDLAVCALGQAERAFNVERGFTRRRFLPDRPWDDLHHGRLAGERLVLAARQIDAALLSESAREFELTKHVSLRKHFGQALLGLKLTGSCVVDLPEWLFDLDFPGHLMRRLKSVSLSIPCQVGLYGGVFARLTLLTSTTRIDPRLRGPQGRCCCGDEAPDGGGRGRCGCDQGCDEGCGRGCGDCAGCESACDGLATGCPCTGGYDLEPCDNRAVRDYGARHAIATSTGDRDTGLFEVNFRDERVLPFEFGGAVSRWKLELPPENNEIDLDTVSDVVMHLSYTARDGGPVLREAARRTARRRLPDSGVRIIDLHRELPQEWARLTAERESRRLDVRLSRDQFAFVQGTRDVVVHRLELLVEAAGAAPSTHREAEFLVAEDADSGCAPDEEYPLTLVSGYSPACGFFHGGVDVRLGPLRSSTPRLLGAFAFEEPLCDVSRLYLVVHYELVERVG